LIILSPVIGTIALLIRYKLGSPIIFKQARPGKNEKIFYLYKFRSMTNELDENGILLPDNKRLTKFGKFLRASSLDELPELVNIIKGDMSIVGPRPLSIYYLPHYSIETRRRHDVKPGLTGLAQVNGRNNLEWDERFALDVKYVDSITFIGDIKIIFDTILKVIKATDVVVRGLNKVVDFGPYSILREEGAVTMKHVGMSYPEIGSYFWIGEENTSVNLRSMDEVTDAITWLPDIWDSSFTFSGRAAIELALRDILIEKKVKKAYVPSYCCISMLQPFIDHGIQIEFYDVTYERGTFHYAIDFNKEVEIVLIMRYFGFHSGEFSGIIKGFHDKKVTIIEDITHSLLNEQPYSENSDYLVASLRKWFPIPTGGWIGKKTGELSSKPDIKSNHAVESKIRGMKEKADYIVGKIHNKENFLMLQSKFENDLIHADSMLKLDNISYGILKKMDIGNVKSRRKKNVQILRERLADLRGVLFEYPEFDIENDTPLFMPIFLKNKDREALRKYLIQAGIYCPVHWPEIMGATIGVRENELSLICDQRYTENDMKVISDCIHEWYQKK